MEYLVEIAHVVIHLAGAWQIGSWLGHLIIWLFYKFRGDK